MDKFTLPRIELPEQVAQFLQRAESQTDVLLGQIQQRATPPNAFLAGVTLGGFLGAYVTWFIFQQHHGRTTLVLPGPAEEPNPAASAGGHAGQVPAQQDPPTDAGVIHPITGQKMERSKTNENLFKHDLVVCHQKLLQALDSRTTPDVIVHTINMMFNQRVISCIFPLVDLVNLVSAEGETLLSRSLRVENTQLAKHLLQLGADPTRHETEISALLSACNLLDYELVSRLVAHPNTDLSEPEHQDILLQVLITPANDQIRRALVEKIAIFLIDKGAEVHHKTEVDFGEHETLTALEVAVEKGFNGVALKLLTVPDILRFCFKDEKHQTVLHRAVQHNELDVVRRILKLHDHFVTKMIETTNEAGKTVLHLAAENRITLVMPHLLEDPRMRALLNSQDNRGETALHFLAMNKNAEMFRYLLLSGADPNIPNMEHQSAFGIAVANGIDVGM